MLAELLRGPAYQAYRHCLQTSLGIPVDASEQAIHQRIVAGFSAATANTFCALDVFSEQAFHQIVSLNTLQRRLARGQLLSRGESDRLFRLAHVSAMAQVVFGDKHKAQRWLSKPKHRWAGQAPVALLCTHPGMGLVEQWLIQLAEGMAF